MAIVRPAPEFIRVRRARRAPLSVHEAAWRGLSPEERNLIVGGLLGFALGAFAALVTGSLRVGEISYLVAALTVADTSSRSFRPILVGGTRYFFSEVAGARRSLRTFLIVHFVLGVLALADLVRLALTYAL